MKIPRCACRWCEGRPPYWDGADDVQAFAEHLLSCSGPFDDSEDVHALALAVKTLLAAVLDRPAPPPEDRGEWVDGYLGPEPKV